VTRRLVDHRNMRRDLPLSANQFSISAGP
jgi:hypothetical protein